jgi:hypothetical protein
MNLGYAVSQKRNIGYAVSQKRESSLLFWWAKQTLWSLVREQTIPTEQLPLVDEI